ncbi:hypothetical protein [Thauera sinica]|uniref:Uncharacterized protein n=1 Tax=Thauera sinica TaxID=2665146 RepID=A0ABW1AU56_9RHOO|nr:hypothetical protein [Thauera sp. K11]ATE59986.1 hypothetical protein CCZ27_08510 [Thauera sp. K11]
MSTQSRDAQLAILSDAACLDTPPQTVGDWTMLGKPLPDASGFFGVAYANETTREIVMIYRGTEELFSDEAGIDLVFADGSWHPQFEAAAAFTTQIKLLISGTKYSRFSLLTTGYDPGGGIARLMNRMFGLDWHASHR